MVHLQNSIFFKMKSYQILRELLVERVRRAMRVDKNKMILECQRLGISENYLYDFTNYQRAFVQKKMIARLYFATKSILG